MSRRPRSITSALPMAALVAVAVLGGGAGPAAAGEDRTLEVELGWGAACPSLLGCDTSLRFTTDGDTVGVGGSLDGMGGVGRAIRVSLPEGPVTITMDISSVAVREVDGDDITSHLTPMTSCSRDILLGGSEGVSALDATVRWERPEAGSTTAPRTSPRRAAWTCDLVPGDDGVSPPWSYLPPPVLLVPAVTCVTSRGGTMAGCTGAIDAARATRPAFEAAPLAMAALACDGDELPRCGAEPSYAVVFAIRDDGGPPWSSDALLVEFDGGTPAVSDLFRSQLLPGDLFGQMLEYGIGARSRWSRETPLTTARFGSTQRCHGAALTGVLASRFEDGVGLSTGDSAVDVTWPAGWTARVVPEGIVVLDADGVVVAREGQLLSVGGTMRDERFRACGEVRLLHQE